MSDFTSDAQSHPNAPTRDKLFTRWGHLKTERATWWAHWQEISVYLLPRSGRFYVTDRDKGWRRHNTIYDNTGTRALRVLGAGMMAGATSPARPWFRLGTADPELNAYQPVKLWLTDVTQRMQMVFARSNTYRTLHQMYEELGAFGTTASIVLPDYQNIIHHYPVTVGEFAIAQDYQGKVCTIYREFEKTVGEIVKEYGYNKCSTTVKNMYDRGSLDQWIRLIQAIEPRADRDIRKKDALNMAWGSYTFEVGGNPKEFLRESGFKDFPALVPRWATAGGDIYGNSPGMECLGDVKQLQHEQMRKAQGIDYLTKPPLQAPPNMKGREIDTLPGGVSYVEQTGSGGGIRTAFEARIDLSHLLGDIQDVRQRIQGGFFADMFLMMANDDRSGITATEVAERHEEKMLMLGPVVERLHNEILTPLIDMTFDIMVEVGIIPRAPDEMQGMELNVEFVSVLAQAQRAVATNSVDRFIGNMGAVAQFKPEVLDKLDADRWADEYADMLGVNPSLIVPKDKVAMIRQQRAAAVAQANQAAQMEQMAGAAQKLGSVQTPTGNAASDVMQAFTGYT